jgi:hypothetical protein
VTTHHLVIAAANGEVAEFDLNDVRSVKLLDEGTQRDIREFGERFIFRAPPRCKNDCRHIRW